MIVLKDLEIERLRETAVKAESTLQAWMERALSAERLRSMPPAEPSSAAGVEAKRPVQRPRTRGSLRTVTQGDAIVPDTSGTVALIVDDNNQRDHGIERLPR